MFQSLYSVLSPLRAKKVTGTLSLEHRDGQKVIFSLYKGDVVSCLNGKRHGSSAARVAATWLDFNSSFYEGIVSEQKDDHPVDRTYFEMLASIDQRVQQYSRLIPHNEIRFRIQNPGFDGEVEFKGYELKVAILLDGSRTVSQVATETGVSDFLVLSSIYKFFDLNMVEML